MSALCHHMDQINERSRAMDEEWRKMWEAREQDKRYRFCKFLIGTGRITDYPITPVFYRVTTRPKETR